MYQGYDLVRIIAGWQPEQVMMDSVIDFAIEEPYELLSGSPQE
jgi:hypothetical protein